MIRSPRCRSSASTIPELVAQHLAHRHARPPRDHLADDRRVDLDAHERRLALQRARAPRCARRASARSGARVDAPPPASAAPATACSICPRSARISCTSALSRVQRSVSSASSASTSVRARGDHAQALAVVGAERGLAGEHALLHGEVVEHPARALQRGRRGLLAECQPRARGVEHAHRLVRQLAVRQVPVRQPHRGVEAVVGDAHLVVRLERRHHAAQHGQALLFGGLLHLHELEAARQRRVLLEELLVLGPRGGGDRAQLAARERRLQQVGGVVLPGRAAGPDHRVRLVDEEDDRRRGVLDLVDQPLEAVLELALHPGARLEQRQVEGAERDVAQRLRHVALGDAPGEALHHRGLADAGLAHEDRVVLAPAGEDVDHLAHLEVAPEHRVDLPGLGLGREVDGVLVEVGRAPARLGRPGAAGRAGGGPGERGVRGPQLSRRLDRRGRDRREVLAQRVRRDLLQLAADLARQPLQLVVGHQR
jgi:hypothetical protein